MALSKKTKWILLIVGAIIGIVLLVFFIPIYEWMITPGVAVQLQSNNNFKKFLKANEGKVTLLSAFGKFESLENLLKDKKIEDYKLRFDWVIPETLGFDCVDGKIIVDKNARNSSLNQLDGLGCRESFPELSRIWNESEVSMTVKDGEIPLDSNDLLDGCQLYCTYWNDNALAFIRTDGEHIYDWSVRDFTFDRAYSSSSTQDSLP